MLSDPLRRTYKKGAPDGRLFAVTSLLDRRFANGRQQSGGAEEQTGEGAVHAPLLGRRAQQAQDLEARPV